MLKESRILVEGDENIVSMIRHFLLQEFQQYSERRFVIFGINIIQVKKAKNEPMKQFEQILDSELEKFKL